MMGLSVDNPSADSHWAQVDFRLADRSLEIIVSFPEGNGL
jgi:hypothetical protein